MYPNTRGNKPGVGYSAYEYPGFNVKRSNKKVSNEWKMYMESLPLWLQKEEEEDDDDVDSGSFKCDGTFKFEEVDVIEPRFVPKVSHQCEGFPKIRIILSGAKNDKENDDEESMYENNLKKKKALEVLDLHPKAMKVEREKAMKDALVVLELHQKAMKERSVSFGSVSEGDEGYIITPDIYRL